MIMTIRLSRLLYESRHIARVQPQSLRPSCTCFRDVSMPTSPCTFQRYNSTASSSSNYFPWHHSPNMPARLPDDLSGMPNNFRARFVRQMIAGRELNLKFWDIPMVMMGFRREWEQELTANFAVGVSGFGSFCSCMVVYDISYIHCYLFVRSIWLCGY